MLPEMDPHSISGSAALPYTFSVAASNGSGADATTGPLTITVADTPVLNRLPSRLNSGVNK